jgi:hypothetical protein
MKQNLIDRITEYLSMGGLFNPELMDEEEVNRLLIDVRDYLLSNDVSVTPSNTYNKCSVCGVTGSSSLSCPYPICPSKVT